MFRRKGQNKRKKHDAELSQLRREHLRQRQKVADCFDKLPSDEAQRRAKAALQALMSQAVKETT